MLEHFRSPEYKFINRIIMSYRVHQHPTDIRCLVKNDGDQLHLVTQTLKILEETVQQTYPVVLLCAIGEPSTGKTGIINGIFNHLMSYTSSDRQRLKGFMQPGRNVQNGPKIDCILACTPPFVVENENTGQCVSILLVDVWNNSVMSEDVYVRLFDFCFGASSIRIFPLWGPVHPISWWGGSGAFQSSSSSSAELKQFHLQLGQRRQQWHSLPEPGQQFPGSFNSGTSNGLAISTCWSNDIDLVIVDGPSLSPHHVNCLLAQAFNLTATAGRKPSDLAAHFLRCIHSILIESYVNKMRQIYEDSPELFLTSQQLIEHSNKFVNDCGHTTKEPIFATLCPYFDQLREFHGNIQVSMAVLKTEVDQKVEAVLNRHEARFVDELEIKEQENASSSQKYESLQNNVEPISQEVTTQVLKFLHSLSSVLLTAGATEIFTAKLKATIRENLFSQLASLENQMELCREAVIKFKNELDQKFPSNVCFSNEQFDQEVWRVRASIDTEHLIRPILKQGLEKIMEKHADQLRLQNEKLNAQLEFAFKAIDIAVASLKTRMMTYVETHAVLRNQDLLTAVNILSKNVKIAFISVPGFSENNSAWEMALKSLGSAMEKCYKDIRQSNVNAERRWDNAFKSANDKSVKMYHELMNQSLPPHKVEAESLNEIHKTCTKEAMDQVNVSSEVNAPTREYWNRIILGNLEEGKEDYEYENELKNWKTEEQQAPSFTPHTSSEPSGVTHTSTSDGAHVVTRATSLSPCNVGIYFGPEVVIFTPHVPDGARSTDELSLKPHVTYWNGKICWGDEAHSVPAGSGELTFNVFSILTTKPVAPTQQPSRVVQFNGQSVLLTPEAMAVLFFREAIHRLSAQADISIQSCTLSHPGLLPAEAATAIEEALVLAGIPEVTLELVAAAIAKNLLLCLPTENLGTRKHPRRMVTIYHAGPFLEVALLHAWPGQLETRELNGYSDLPAQKPEELQWRTSGLLQEVNFRDLFTIVMMIENEGNPEVAKALNKKMNEMHCEYKIPVDQVDIATTLAHARANHGENVSHSKRPIPMYDFSCPNKDGLVVATYRKIKEAFVGKTPTPVHSDWSKLLTLSGREIVKTNVERIVKVLRMDRS